MPIYKVIASYKGQPVEFTEEAPTAPKAVMQARKTGKAQGMTHIMVTAVQFPEEDSAVSAPICLDESHPQISHGRDLTLAEISAEIERVLGDVPLRAYGEGGRIYLADGFHQAAEVQDRSQVGVIELLYDWAVLVGFTNEDFEDFLEMT